VFLPGWLDAVRALPEAIRHIIVGAYSDALTPVFLYMVPFVILAAVVLIFLKEKPLATTLDRGRREQSTPENAGMENPPEAGPGAVHVGGVKEPKHRAGSPESNT
jgi:hypothetical protein